MDIIKVKVTKVSDSGNSVMVFLPENPLTLQNPLTAKNAKRTNAYVALPEEMVGKHKKGDDFDLPVGYSLVEAADEDGTIMTYEDGNSVMFAKW